MKSFVWSIYKNMARLYRFIDRYKKYILNCQICKKLGMRYRCRWQPIQWWLYKNGQELNENDKTCHIWPAPNINAVIYSITEITKTNYINLFCYLSYVLTALKDHQDDMDYSFIEEMQSIENGYLGNNICLKMLQKC